MSGLVERGGENVKDKKAFLEDVFGFRRQDAEDKEDGELAESVAGSVGSVGFDEEDFIPLESSASPPPSAKDLPLLHSGLPPRIRTPKRKRAEGGRAEASTPSKKIRAARYFQAPPTPCSDSEDRKSDKSESSSPQPSGNSGEVQSQSDDEIWKILIRGDNTRGTRYFQENPMASVKCFKCGKKGHFARDCDARSPCFLCMGMDHVAWECPNDPCDRCFQKGHDSTRCPNHRASLKMCFRCGGRDHWSVDCTSKEKPKKSLRCMICFKAGDHLNCIGPKKAKQIFWCANCGSKGHTRATCKNPSIMPEVVGKGLHCGNKNRLRPLKSCYHCASLWHVARDCPERYRRRNDRWERSSQNGRGRTSRRYEGYKRKYERQIDYGF